MSQGTGAARSHEGERLPTPTAVRQSVIAARRALRVVTKCATLDAFVTAFAPLTQDTSVFIATTAPRPIGPRQPFVIQLRDGTPVLQGEGEVVESIHDPEAPIRGMRVRLLELDQDSRAVHQRLLARAEGVPDAARAATEDANDGPAGAQPLPPQDPEEQIRAPRAHAELPANPFEAVTSGALEAFVDCTLFENRVAMKSAAMLDPFARPQGAPPPDVARDHDASRDRPGSQAAGFTARWLPPGRRWPAMLGASVVASVLATLAVAYLLWGRPQVPSHRPPSDGTSEAAAPIEPTTSPAPVASAARLPSLLPQQRCTATVRSDPPGAGVLFNGELLGSTPLDGISVPCGIGALALEHAEHVRLERRVDAVPGRMLYLYEHMKRPPVELEITTTPPGAKVAVRGRFIGRSPLTAVVSGFTDVKVVASLAGYRPASVQIVPRPPTATAHVDLEPLKAP